MQSQAQTTGSKSQSEFQHWRPRDYVAAAALFLASAAFVLWQSSRVAVLWDLSYLLDTSYRIALGQMPYRDFPLVHAPLTFLVQAAIIRMAGRHYLLTVWYAAAAGGLGTVVSWRILLRTLRNGTGSSWAHALLLAAPLTVVGVYAIYPHPIYDCDCTLAILIALLLLIRLDSSLRRTTPGVRWLAFAAGAASVLPLFFKQNMGLPFLMAIVAGVSVLIAAEAIRARSIRNPGGSPLVFLLAGAASAMAAALAAIAVTAGLQNYFHWTVQFAAQRRLPGLASMLAVYNQPSFVWTLPALGAGLVLCHSRRIERLWGKLIACCLIAAPFVASLIYLFLQDDADERADNLLALWPLWLLAALVMALFGLRRGITLGTLMPFFVLAAIHGTFLSQQLWGSTYALWPLLLILMAQMLAALPAAARPVVTASAITICITFAVCGGLYAQSLERLSYVQIPNAAIEHSRLPALKGVADRGSYLRNLDELVEFTSREIRRNDALLIVPGEDPFYFATGRTPRFPVLLFDPATDPYSPAELLREARRRDVKWAVVKRELQLRADPAPDSEETLRLISQDFVLYHRLDGYDVYRRR